MSKIKSIADLKEVRKDAKRRQLAFANAEGAGSLVRIKVAMATCGIASGAREIMDFMSDAMEKRGVNALVAPVGCMGYCYAEPTVEVTLPGRDPVVFGEVDREKADEIIEKYIKGGEPVEGIIPVNYETVD